MKTAKSLKGLQMGAPLGSPPKGGNNSREPGLGGDKFNTNTGSGSRPGAGTSYPIETSSPGNWRTMDRDPPAGWLGSGSTRKRGD
jgi:hypothetical protein